MSIGICWGLTLIGGVVTGSAIREILCEIGLQLYDYVLKPSRSLFRVIHRFFLSFSCLRKEKPKELSTGLSKRTFDLERYVVFVEGFALVLLMLLAQVEQELLMLQLLAPVEQLVLQSYSLCSY